MRTAAKGIRDGVGERIEVARLLRGSISAICLPVMADDLDEDGLRHDVRHCIDVLGSGGLYVHGFYGHFWLLDPDTRRRVIEIVVAEVRGAVPVICRCWSMSLTETISLTRHAEDAGADMVSVLGPWLGANSDTMVLDWFSAIAAETNLGLSVFNTAQLGYVMTPELLARLSQIPNVTALKNHVDGSHTKALRDLVGESVVVVDPEEERFLDSMLDGGQRAIYSGTNYMFDSADGRPMHDYIESALAGDQAAATIRYQAMQPLRDLHRTWVIEPWIRDRRCPIATVKRWSEAMGMTGGGVPRPLDDLSVADRERLWEEISAARIASRELSASN